LVTSRVGSGEVRVLLCKMELASHVPLLVFDGLVEYVLEFSTWIIRSSSLSKCIPIHLYGGFIDFPIFPLCLYVCFHVSNILLNSFVDYGCMSTMNIFFLISCKRNNVLSTNLQLIYDIFLFMYV